MAVGNAVIFMLYLHDSHWGEEYGSRYSIVFLGAIVVCVPLVWKRSKSVAIAALVLSMPMAWLWGNWIVKIVAFAAGGDT